MSTGGDAERYFRQERERHFRLSVEEEFAILSHRYKEHIILWPQRNMSALAEETLWELHMAQQHLSKKWDARTRAERRRLRAVLRWLHRIGIREMNYEEVMPKVWEDVAVVLYLWQNPGMQKAFPTLTAELLE